MSIKQKKRRRRNRNGKEYAGEEVAHFNFRPSYVVGDACAGGRSIGVGYAPYLEAGGRDQPGDVRGAVVLRGGGEREHEVKHMSWISGGAMEINSVKKHMKVLTAQIPHCKNNSNGRVYLPDREREREREREVSELVEADLPFCEHIQRPCSSSKMREMTGSGIFAADNENEVIESSNAVPNPNNKTSVRICQQAVNAISQISFNTEEKVSPKKPTSISEVAKQRELSGTVESELDAKVKKQLSEAKSKELSGNDIFGPPPEVPARPLAARNLELRGNLDFTLPQPRNIHTSVKVSNPAGGPSHITFSEESDTKTTKKIHTQKFQELTGNDIFKEDAAPGSTEKTLSEAKLKEMSGSDIFADGKTASRDYFGGVRKPPGGESSIALV
ncbi:hypothetical protein ZIOFF_053732 [Zingiber officinale]|uniref:DUF4057 domain-containing protein n=1 Tax=Zingiber officinale TaxID=94328 RepID=A0A8J5FEX8_ZINOF|nr:hypothetical protein ZIOFF_053732 [Zingiber officinale]